MKKMIEKVVEQENRIKGLEKAKLEREAEIESINLKISIEQAYLDGMQAILSEVK